MDSRAFELAWAAGFFDGEGHTALLHIKPRRARDYPSVRITVTQADREILERFREAVGDGNIIGPITKNRPGRKPLYRLSKNGPAAIEILRKLWPWLSEPKRRQARIAVDAYNASLAGRRPYGTKPRSAVIEL